MISTLDLNPEASVLLEAYERWRDSTHPLFVSYIPPFDEWEEDIRWGLQLLNTPIEKIFTTDIDFSLGLVRKSISLLSRLTNSPSPVDYSQKLGTIVSRYLIKNFTTIRRKRLKDIIEICTLEEA